MLWYGQYTTITGENEIAPRERELTVAYVLLTTNEVAARLRTPSETLRYWRAIGKGPRGFRVGRRVLYRASDVDAWEEEQYNAHAIGASK